MALQFRRVEIGKAIDGLRAVPSPVPLQQSDCCIKVTWRMCLCWAERMAERGGGGHLQIQIVIFTLNKQGNCKHGEFHLNLSVAPCGMH